MWRTKMIKNSDLIKNKGEKYGIDDLLAIMERLRQPDGCPWDREQDHHSIRNDFIEETYEAAEAIDRENREELCEELGDVLLQIVFHCQIEREQQGFDFTDVCDGICKKLIERHPHVFGSVSVENSDEVLENWDMIKQKSKHQNTFTDTLKSVPAAYPALMRAQKIQKRAKKAGFDWDDVDGTFKKLYEEMNELKAAVAEGNDSHIFEEYGDLLFSAVNVSRFLKVDSEQALNGATNKFVSRFERVEKSANEKGIDMKDSTLETLDALWDEAKTGK